MLGRRCYATEVFDDSRWLKPARTTQVSLVSVIDGEVAWCLYEMGIPIYSLGIGSTLSH